MASGLAESEEIETDAMTWEMTHLAG